MAFDRSKFKKAKIEEVDENLNKAQETMSQFGKQGGRASFLSLAKEGRYEIRILPSETQRPYVPRKCAKLPIECTVFDKDGKDTGKKEIRMKDVFTSDVHSDRMQGQDAVAIYIEYIDKMVAEIQDSDERKKFRAPITGFRKTNGEWVWGIAPTLNYVAYVLYDKEIHRMDIRPQWWKAMKSISIERSKKAVSLDVFSDHETGYPLIINYYKDEKKKNVYDLSCGLPEVGETWDEFFESNRVPDSVLEALDQLPSLEDQYVDVFSRKDWDMQLEGLKRIDEKYGFDIFENDEFLDRLEQLEALVPEVEDVKKTTVSSNDDEEDEQEDEVRVSVKREPSAKPTQTASKSTTSGYPPLIKMKAELKQYIETEYEGTEVLPDLPIVEMRKWYDLMKQGMMLPFDDYKEKVVEDLPFDEGDSQEAAAADESPVEKAATKASRAVSESVKDKLARLRAERGKK